MGAKSRDLAQRLQAFADEVLGVVQGCSREDWGRRCASEDWSVGVTARHIAAGHFGTLGLVKTLAAGGPLPQLTRAQVVAMANDHAAEHADCTPEEVAGLLRCNAADMTAYVTGLEDGELDRRGFIAFIGIEMSLRQFLEAVILKSGGGHLASIRAAIAGV
jgi:hypothetical protein